MGRKLLHLSKEIKIKLRCSKGRVVDPSRYRKSTIASSSVMVIIFLMPHYKERKDGDR